MYRNYRMFWQHSPSGNHAFCEKHEEYKIKDLGKMCFNLVHNKEQDLLSISAMNRSGLRWMLVFFLHQFNVEEPVCQQIISQSQLLSLFSEIIEFLLLFPSFRIILLYLRYVSLVPVEQAPLTVTN